MSGHKSVSNHERAAPLVAGEALLGSPVFPCAPCASLQVLLSVGAERASVSSQPCKQTLQGRARAVTLRLPKSQV